MESGVIKDTKITKGLKMDIIVELENNPFTTSAEWLNTVWEIKNPEDCILECKSSVTKGCTYDIYLYPREYVIRSKWPERAKCDGLVYSTKEEYTIESFLKEVFISNFGKIISKKGDILYEQIHTSEISNRK